MGSVLGEEGRVEILGEDRQYMRGKFIDYIKTKVDLRLNFNKHNYKNFNNKFNIMVSTSIKNKNDQFIITNIKYMKLTLFVNSNCGRCSI